jgi:hypothetical protein
LKSKVQERKLENFIKTTKMSETQNENEPKWSIVTAKKMKAVREDFKQAATASVKTAAQFEKNVEMLDQFVLV